MMKVAHTTSAGANVFADLGLADAANLQLRARLLAEIKRYIEASGLTQRKAAEAMKTTQPRLKDVLHGAAARQMRQARHKLQASRCPGGSRISRERPGD